MTQFCAIAQPLRMIATFALIVLISAGCMVTLSTASPAHAVRVAEADAAPPPLPLHLHDTGLYRADGKGDDLHAEVIAFAPQYTLWSDGALKRRWLRLPAGAAIDASDPDAWRFPRGTRLWKEFSHNGRKVETRLIERLANGDWRYAAYVWSEDGRSAVLAPEGGVKALPVAQAPGGFYDIPARADCRACHEGAAVPVLGASALQLSPARDELAAHAQMPSRDDADLPSLVERGALRGLPAALLDRPPRIAAASPTERAALGYLHANCGHCHNDSEGRAPVRLRLAQSAVDPQASRERALASMLQMPSRFRPAAALEPAVVVAPGAMHRSVLGLRMASRDAQEQMPPLGTRVPDAEGLALIQRWIDNDLPTRKEP